MGCSSSVQAGADGGAAAQRGAAGGAPAKAPDALADAQYVTSGGTPLQVVEYNVHSWFHTAAAPRATPEAKSTLRASGPRGKLTILHFNDVYEIDAGKVEPVGGAARFATVLTQHAADNPLVLFSGDALNPSNLSKVTYGRHMIECLNLMNVAAACVGNHDLDLGEPNLADQIRLSNFPWLCSNCWHKENGVPLGTNAVEAVVAVHAGYKIGIIGLIENDWLACCTTVQPASLDYTDFVEVGRKLAAKLRADEGCDFVIALTHFREPNDERLAAEAPEIDLVLGGHDHHYAKKAVEPTGTWYVKSGADFKWLSRIDIEPGTGGGGARGAVSVQQLEVNSAVEQDPALAAICDYYLANQRAAMARRLATLECELQARFADVRTKETNCGNWVADIARVGCGADVGLLISGTLRADVVFPAGPFTVEDLLKLLPFDNLLAVKALKGADLLDALENGVSKWPNKEGRFPQVSNLKFTFDGSKPAGERVQRDSVMVGGEPLDAAREYSVAALSFTADGKEGYDAFTRRMLKDDEMTTDLKTLVRNHCVCLEAQSKMLAMVSKKSSVALSKTALVRWKSKTSSSGVGKPQLDASWLSDDNASKRLAVNPRVEGRIVNLAEAAAEA